MNKEQILKKVEKYVKKIMSQAKDQSHDFGHVNRVRNWAMKIGKKEGGVNMFYLEITALLHDIGRLKETKNISHYVAGKKMAKKFLTSLNYFDKKIIENISQSIYEHGPGGESKLTKILQDADRMDGCGAIIIARIFILFGHKPIFIDKNSFNFKERNEDEIQELYQNKKINSFQCVMEHFNLAFNIIDIMHTKTAQEFAKDKINFMKKFCKELEKEVV